MSEIKSKEEILKTYESFHWKYDGLDETHYYLDNVLLAMEEYANQFKQANGADKRDVECTLPDVVQQSEQFKVIVFKMANKLALADKGDQAVQMHRIHNSL
jgi:hypothetical protein